MLNTNATTRVRLWRPKEGDCFCVLEFPDQYADQHGELKQQMQGCSVTILNRVPRRDQGHLSGTQCVNGHGPYSSIQCKGRTNKIAIVHYFSGYQLYK